MALLPGDVRFLHIPVNWSSGYEVTYEYKTDIFTSRSGKEQRRALRTTPRRSFAYRGLIYGGKLGEVQSALMGWQGKRFIIADETQYARLAVASAPSSSVLNLDSVYEWLEVGEQVIVSDGTRSSLYTVLGIGTGEGYQIIVDDDNSYLVDDDGAWIVDYLFEGTPVEFGDAINVDGADAAGWPAGTRVYRTKIARFETSQNMIYRTAGAAEIGLTYRLDPLVEEILAPSQPENLYRNVELFTRRPNWAYPPTFQMTANVDFVDFDRGAIIYYEPQTFRQKQLKFTYLSKSYEDAQSMVDFFMRMKGRRGSFYAPTWVNDLDPYSGYFFNAGRSFYVKSKGPWMYLSGDPAHKDIAFIMKDWSIRPARVQEILPAGNSSQVDLVDTMTGFSLDDVRMICWLHRWRFVSDSFTVNYVADGIAEYSPTFISLESDREL